MNPIYTSPLTKHNHYFNIYFECEIYYIELCAYSATLNLIGIYYTLESAKSRVQELSQVL